ncbi:hypothetical protein EYF80_029531 [Liparis tanakae]|uniref:Uncharacterized protein n=1 Tax=Liparis tanakae TaxID=230148 RepID=A0A4Z2H341_9TELE|nr:hypothetical protein EYF80_029531 [Liparis tanakae]
MTTLKVSLLDRMWALQPVVTGVLGLDRWDNWAGQWKQDQLSLLLKAIWKSGTGFRGPTMRGQAEKKARKESEKKVELVKQLSPLIFGHSPTLLLSPVNNSNVSPDSRVQRRRDDALNNAFRLDRPKVCFPGSQNDLVQIGLSTARGRNASPQPPAPKDTGRNEKMTPRKTFQEGTLLMLRLVAPAFPACSMKPDKHISILLTWEGKCMRHKSSTFLRVRAYQKAGANPCVAASRILCQIPKESLMRLMLMNLMPLMPMSLKLLYSPGLMYIILPLNWGCSYISQWPSITWQDWQSFMR